MKKHKKNSSHTSDSESASFEGEHFYFVPFWRLVSLPHNFRCSFSVCADSNVCVSSSDGSSGERLFKRFRRSSEQCHKKFM